MRSFQILFLVLSVSIIVNAKPNGKYVITFFKPRENHIGAYDPVRQFPKRTDLRTKIVESLKRVGSTRQSLPNPQNGGGLNRPGQQSSNHNPFQNFASTLQAFTNSIFSYLTGGGTLEDPELNEFNNALSAITDSSTLDTQNSSGGPAAPNTNGGSNCPNYPYYNQYPVYGPNYGWNYRQNYDPNCMPYPYYQSDAFPQGTGMPFNQQLQNGHLPTVVVQYPPYPPGNAQYPPVNPQYPPSNHQYRPANPQFPPGNLQYTTGTPLYQPANQQYPPVNQQYPAGNHQYPPGNYQYPQANQQYPPVNHQYSPGHQQYSPGHQQYAPGNQQYAPGNHQYLPANQQYSPGNQPYSPGNHQYPQGNQQYPQADQQYPPGNHHYSPGHPQYTPGNQHYPIANAPYKPPRQQYQQYHRPNQFHHYPPPNHHYPTVSPQYPPPPPGNRPYNLPMSGHHRHGLKTKPQRKPVSLQGITGVQGLDAMTGLSDNLNYISNGQNVMQRMQHMPQSNEEVQTVPGVIYSIPSNNNPGSDFSQTPSAGSWQISPQKEIRIPIVHDDSPEIPNPPGTPNLIQVAPEMFTLQMQSSPQQDQYENTYRPSTNQHEEDVGDEEEDIRLFDDEYGTANDVDGDDEDDEN